MIIEISPFLFHTSVYNYGIVSHAIVESSGLISLILIQEIYPIILDLAAL